MDACPDKVFIGVVNPPAADRLPLRGEGLNLNKIEHFSKVSPLHLN
jgi:hypothetical protein